MQVKIGAVDSVWPRGSTGATSSHKRRRAEELGSEEEDGDQRQTCCGIPDIKSYSTRHTTKYPTTTRRVGLWEGGVDVERVMKASESGKRKRNKKRKYSKRMTPRGRLGVVRQEGKIVKLCPPDELNGGAKEKEKTVSR